MTQSKWRTYAGSQSKNKQTSKIVWIKVILLELKTFIKHMVKCEKAGNRKDIKIIITEKVEDVYAFRAIH